MTPSERTDGTGSHERDSGAFSEDDIACLKGSGLFPELDDADLALLVPNLQKKTYPTGTVIAREGAPSDAMFIIKEGTVELRKKGERHSADRVVATLRDGSAFGEMGIATGQPMKTTAVAIEATDAYVLEKNDFQGLMRDSISIANAISRLANNIGEDLQRKLGMVSLRKVELKRDLVLLIPGHFLKEQRVLPIALSQGTLTLAMVNPGDLLTVNLVKKFVKDVRIDPICMDEDEFRAFMKNVYPGLVKEGQGEVRGLVPKGTIANASGLAKDPVTNAGSPKEAEVAKGIGEVEKEASHAPIVQLANEIISSALEKKASDIHLEPADTHFRVRIRVDGVLREERILSKEVISPLVNRFKVLSRLDITERRIPQDGRINLRVNGRAIDFRVSTIPVKYGEKVVIRILDKEVQVFGLDKVITRKATLDVVRGMIKKPYGIVFVTGPTGSGKTTTLYSALAEVNTPEVNISTVEDPIEYDLSGINQVEVNPEIGLDFARVLRAFLRQDPDIMLVGETRDRETAKIAVEAALTGHLVLTTLHTNDAPSTFVRLSEMGIEPFLLSTTIIGIVAQRLVRRICPNCREPREVDEVVARYLGFKKGAIVYKGRGCSVCNNTGYMGRVGVYEVLVADDGVRHLISRSASADEIRAKAVDSGMNTLRDYALTLLKDGVTTVDEMLRTVAIEG